MEQYFSTVSRREVTAATQTAEVNMVAASGQRTPPQKELLACLQLVTHFGQKVEYVQIADDDGVDSYEDVTDSHVGDKKH